MTGPEIRALLKDWGVSRRVLADTLATENFHISDDAEIVRWKDRVPATVVRLIERWKENPDQRPGKKQPNVARNGREPKPR